MKNQILRRFMSVAMAAAMGTVLLAGCGKSAGEAPADGAEVPGAEAVAETPAAEGAEDTAASQDEMKAPYFKKGVYSSFPTSEMASQHTYFYIFYDETSGYTEDGVSGIGLPFACEQTDGQVVFSMGGADEESKDILTVESVSDGWVTGTVQNGISITFAPVPDVDPDNFSAQNYINSFAGEEAVYEDANGWSVKYDPSVIAVNQGGPVTTFVYTGECAGTCMITASYEVGSDAKTAVADKAKAYGDGATTSEASFPGAEDVIGYWAMTAPSTEGSGLIETVVARDYMDGYLMFEMTTHNSGDDAIDIPVSDALAAVIDSLTFNN